MSVHRWDFSARSQDNRSKQFSICTIILISIVAHFTLPLTAAEIPSSWSAAKNTADDQIYMDYRLTLYCGCKFVSDKDSDGSGDVDPDACGLNPLPKFKQKTAREIQWEHIVPASLTPVRGFACWDDRKRIEKCQKTGGKFMSGRSCCLKVSPTARATLLDLHNLAPSVGQVNQYRQNDRYGEVKKHYVTWPNCDAKDQHGVTRDPSGLAKFEPPDCVKGDVARVWFYMQETYGVRIPPEEYKMFLDWATKDPVSPWERERDERIAKVQGNRNHYVSNSEVSGPEFPCEKR